MSRYVRIPLASLILSVLYISPCGGQSIKNIRVGYAGGVFTEARQKDVQVALELWMTNLGRRFDSRVEKITGTVFQDIQEIERTLKADEIDLVGLGSLDYLRLEDHTAMDPVLVGSAGGEVELEYAVFVRKDKNIRRIQDLKGRTLLVESGGSGDLTVVWLETSLLKNGLPEAARFLGNVIMVDKPMQAVVPVFFNQADACLVSLRSFITMKELNPQLGNELSILIQSPRLLPGLICLRRAVGQEFRDDVVNSMARFHMEPEGQQILLTFKMDKIVLFDPSYLKNTRKMFREYRALQAGGETNKKGTKRASAGRQDDRSVQSRKKVGNTADSPALK
ncbi:MAG: hypothetical protein A2W03_14980 [Candidatus Aminicenantes bacterium RBG_16_63_16]|nr:MAG: hypothetical protein A2W03_14980 [Candidatus Aminicenantes bacterium RBG_16_63_16]